MAEILLANAFVLQVVRTTWRYEGQRKNALVWWWSLQRKLHCCWNNISGNLWPIRNSVVRYENRSWHLWVVKVFLLCSLQIPFKHLIEYLQKCSRKVLIKVFFLIKSNFQTPCVFLSVVGMHGFQVEFWWNRASWHITRTLTKICYFSVLIACTDWNMYYSFWT